MSLDLMLIVWMLAFVDDSLSNNTDTDTDGDAENNADDDNDDDLHWDPKN